MTTGLFPIRQSEAWMRRGRAPANRRVPRSQIDAFAEALSWHDYESGNFGGSVAKCAVAMGIPLGRARTLFARIKAELGWQAR